MSHISVHPADKLLYRSCMDYMLLIPRLSRSLPCVQIERNQRRERPLMRRKSELPKDISTVTALELHRRAEEMLTTHVYGPCCQIVSHPFLPLLSVMTVLHKNSFQMHSRSNFSPTSTRAKTVLHKKTFQSLSTFKF